MDCLYLPVTSEVAMDEKKNSDEFRELTEELTGLESNKVINTLRGLTVRPGVVIEYYLKGGRKRFLSPVIYFFALIALQFFLLSLTGFLDHFLEIQVEKVGEAFGKDKDLEEHQVEMMVSQFSGFITFFMSEIGQKLVALPLALLLVWLIYRRKKSGFKPHIWLALYTFGHISLFSIVIALFWNAGLSVAVVNFLTLLFSISYWIFATGQFYKLSLWKSIGFGLLFYLVYFLIFSLVGGIVGIYLGFQIGMDMG
jgi:hypothetical protein